MTLFIGVDVGKNQLDVFCNGDSVQFSNNELGIKKLTHYIQTVEHEKNTTALIVCEATGGYEQCLEKHLHQVKISLHIAHANKIRFYANSKGLLAKTDKVDAKLIANYAKVMEVEKDEILLTESEEKIGRLMKRRNQLVVSKQNDQNRLETETFSDVIHSIHLHVNWIEREIKKLEKLLEVLCQEEHIKENLLLLTSIPLAIENAKLRAID